MRRDAQVSENTVDFRNAQGLKVVFDIFEGAVDQLNPAFEGFKALSRNFNGGWILVDTDYMTILEVF